MDSSGSPGKGVWLADQFATLWQRADVPPDVFAFLNDHPDATSLDRVAVIRVDQRFRWETGLSLPVERYLESQPDVAAWPELVDVLRQEERTARQANAAADETLCLEPTIEGGRGLGETGPSASDLDDSATLIVDDPTLFDRHSAGILSTDFGFATFTFGAGEGVPTTDGAAALQKTTRFAIRRKLGTGGMGVVYEAYDRNRGETVALKTMRRVDPLAIYRFKHEFRTLSDLTHPNLVSLYELFAVGDLWFFTMELVEGTDFITYVRSEVRGDGESACETPATARMERLRSALKQLAEGICVLHDAGKLHRDIKPSNVLVTRQGRVVILDFGLAIELGQSGPLLCEENPIVGTAAYMPPEQATSMQVSTAGDWYSVGVVLYEAITGRPPFEGKLLDVLAAKQKSDPPLLSSVVDSVPADLDTLCSELLRRDPVDRPSGREVLCRLEGTSLALELTPPLSSVPGHAVPLIGRERHLHLLQTTFEAVRAGRTEILFVFGRSGTGKTSLIQAFLEDLADRDETVVLSGRCYERESVPYKALDSLVDALSRYLTRLRAEEVEPLLPRDVALLARVFPVLRRVEAVAASPRPPFETPDQQELRRRAFAALRELLARIGAQRPLVLVIDDLHWGDPEDAALIGDLLRAPDPPVLLFLGSVRTEERETNPLLQALLEPAAKSDPLSTRRELAVEALSQSEARMLALALLGQNHAVARAEAHLIARESRGNPLFIGELVKHAQAEGGLAAMGDIDLDEVLWARVRRLSDHTRRILESVAVSGRPVSLIDVGLASELAADLRASAVAVLRAGRLIRSAGPARRDEVEIYHDRIRETIVGHLTAAQVADHHRRLALTLEDSGRADPEILASHFDGAGLSERAGFYFARAADRASDELAFLHAARLYRQAVSLLRGDAEARPLRTKLGDVLANAGRGREAAQAYLDAASTANVGEALELRRRAAVQLLISGHVDEGLERLQAVLGALGLSLSSSPRGAWLSLAWRRLLLRVRGLNFQVRDPSQVSTEELAKIDVCWSAAAGLSMIDPIRGADFQSRGLLLALRAGEPNRVARAVALEAAHVATAGGPSRRRLARLLRIAKSMADRVGQPHAQGMLRMAQATAALMFGRWKEARDTFNAAEKIFRSRCTGVAWELDTTANLSLWALTRMGDLVELRKRWPELVQEARERGDLYATTTFNTYYMTLLRLADDDPEGAQRELEAVMANWTPRGFHVQHSTALRSRVHTLQYQGEWHAAWREISTYWPNYVRSMLLRIQIIRIELLEMRARSALAAAIDVSAPSALLESAERDVRRLQRERVPFASAHARVLTGGLAAIRGESAAALTALADAAQRFDALDMRLDAVVARRRLGQILGGPQGLDIIRDADEWLAEYGVRDPERMTCIFAPPLPKRYRDGMGAETLSTLL